MAGATERPPASQLPELSQRLVEVLGIDPAAPALWESGRWWTWGQIEQVSRGFAEVLTERGSGAAGTRVAVMMRTTARAVACQLAILSRGWTLYTLSPMIRSDRLVDDVASSGAAVVVAELDDWQNESLRLGIERLGATALTVWPGEEGLAVEVVSSERRGRTHVADPTPLVANIMLTSGTTGPPKRIEISYAALWNMLAAVRHYSRATKIAQDGARLSSHPAVVASPLVHSSGFGGVLRAVAEARPVALLERFAPDAWAAVVEQFRPPVTALPPAALQMLLDAEIDPHRLASLRAIIVGSAALPPSLQDRFEEQYGIPLLCTYGATEFPGGLAGWTLADHRKYRAAKRGSVGRAHPGVELRVTAADSGAELPPGERGLLGVRTPTTDRSVSDGWVVTTDIGSLDADRFLFIHGRADDAIVRGGFKIIPQELEDILLTHPAVVAAGVVGKPDERLGAVPVAFVETSAEVTEEGLLAFLRDRVMSYQVPVAVHVVDQLPRTPSMKISKPDLRAMTDPQPSGVDGGD